MNLKQWPVWPGRKFWCKYKLTLSAYTTMRMKNEPFVCKRVIFPKPRLKITHGLLMHARLSRRKKKREACSSIVQTICTCNDIEDKLYGTAENPSANDIARWIIEKHCSRTSTIERGMNQSAKKWSSPGQCRGISLYQLDKYNTFSSLLTHVCTHPVFIP